MNTSFIFPATTPAASRPEARVAGRLYGTMAARHPARRHARQGGLLVGTAACCRLCAPGGGRVDGTAGNMEMKCLRLQTDRTGRSVRRPQSGQNPGHTQPESRSESRRTLRPVLSVCRSEHSFHISRHAVHPAAARGTEPAACRCPGQETALPHASPCRTPRHHRTVKPPHHASRRAGRRAAFHTTVTRQIQW